MKLARFAVSLSLPFFAAAIGGIVTVANIATWYAGLEKPFFTPPNWLFGPVWTVLYLCIGLSLYYFWMSASKGSKREGYVSFAVQMVLNVLWSIVFFGLHLPWIAFIVILALLAAILATIREFAFVSRPAAWLLVPYVVWVGFAAALNLAVAQMN